MKPENQEWAIPSLDETSPPSPLNPGNNPDDNPSYELPDVPGLAEETMHLRFDHNGSTTVIPVALRPVSMDTLRNEDLTLVIKTLALNSQLTIIVPVEEDMSAISNQMLREHAAIVLDNGQETDTSQLASIIERIHGIGAAAMGVAIVVGDLLHDERLPEAKAAAEAIMEAVKKIQLQR